ncbi:MAG: glycosyltransferase family 2 protein [Planctomycetota bacterium]
MPATMKLSVTIPAQNEARTIGDVVRDIPREIDGIDEVEVIVVDDASDDGTAELAEDAGAKVVTMTGRPGLGPVWRLGMDRAIRGGADLIVNLDGDGQFRSSDVAEIVQPLLRGECDFVHCTRFAHGGPVGRMPAIKRAGNWLVTKLANAICGTKFTDVSCGFRAYNREAAYRLSQFGRWTYTEECVVYLVGRGLRIKEMPFPVLGEREHGKSRVASNVIYFASHLLHILMRAVRDGKPMKFFGVVAALALLPGLLTLVLVGLWAIAMQTTTPFTGVLTIGIIATLIGVLLTVLALLADMVSRHRLIHEELLYLARCRYYASPQADDVPESAALASVFEA